MGGASTSGSVRVGHHGDLRIATDRHLDVAPPTESQTVLGRLYYDAGDKSTWWSELAVPPEGLLGGLASLSWGPGHTPS